VLSSSDGHQHQHLFEKIQSVDVRRWYFCCCLLHPPGLSDWKAVWAVSWPYWRLVLVLMFAYPDAQPQSLEGEEISQSPLALGLQPRIISRHWSPRQKHTKLASPPASNPQDLQSRTVAVAEAVAEAVARRPLSATTSPLAPCRGPLPFLRSSGPRPPLPASHRSATTPPNPIELHKRVFVPLPSVYPISRRLTLSSFLFLCSVPVRLHSTSTYTILIPDFAHDLLLSSKHSPNSERLDSLPHSFGTATTSNAINNTNDLLTSP